MIETACPVFGRKYLPSLPLPPLLSYAGIASFGTGEPRDSRTQTKKRVTRGCDPLSLFETFASLGAIPAGDRWLDAGFRGSAVFHGRARGGQPVGNSDYGVAGAPAGHLRRPDHRALPGAA